MTPVKLLLTCVVIIIVGSGILVATYKPPEEDPSAWLYHRENSLIHGTRYSASLAEIGGPGWLKLECAGHLQAVFDSGRGDFHDGPSPLALRYRVDQAPPVQVEGSFDGRKFWFDFPEREDAPVVAPIQRGRRLVVAMAPDARERIVMRFDVSRSGHVIERLRGDCARPS